MKTNSIHIKPIDQTNWMDCIHLKPSPDQQDYIASNLISLAQCNLNPSWISLAIYLGSITIGCIIYNPIDSNIHLLHFMIDRHYQKKGFGKEAILRFIQQIFQNREICSITLNCLKTNDKAISLFSSIGFIIIDEDSGTFLMRRKRDN